MGLYPQETPGNVWRSFWFSQLGCRYWYSRGKIMLEARDLQASSALVPTAGNCQAWMSTRPATHSLLVSPFASSWVPVFPIPERKAFPSSPHYRARLNEVILCYRTEGDTPSSCPYRVPGSSVLPQSLCHPSCSILLTMMTGSED